MSDWQEFDHRRSLDQVGSEGGIVIADDEHVDGARITLEKNAVAAPFAITCGVYGWMVHTRFFVCEEDAKGDFADMKTALSELVGTLDVRDLKSSGEACAEFIARSRSGARNLDDGSNRRTLPV